MQIGAAISVMPRPPWSGGRADGSDELVDRHDGQEQQQEDRRRLVEFALPQVIALRSS